MAGAFSGHLVNSFYAQQARPSATSAHNPDVITSGAMSFNAHMHGAPVLGNQSTGDYSFSFGSTQPSFFNPELSEATAKKIATLQAKLNQKLGPEYISQRPGPGGGPKLTYAEGWKIINLANEVFGFNGWSSSIVNLTTDFVDYNEESRRYNVGATAIVRVTLRDGVFHEDLGYGMLENSKSKGAALDKVRESTLTILYNLIITKVQERGCDGWLETSIAQLRKFIGELSIRQGIYTRGGEDQGATGKFNPVLIN